MDRRTAIAYLRQLAPAKNVEIKAMLGLLGVTSEEYRAVVDSGVQVFASSGTWTKPKGALDVTEKIAVGHGGGGSWAPKLEG